jgi:hypothetical protein
MFTFIMRKSLRYLLLLGCTGLTVSTAFAQRPAATTPIKEKAVMATSKDPKVKADPTAPTATPSVTPDKETIKGYMAFIDGLDATLSMEQRIAAINGYTEKTYKRKGTLNLAETEKAMREMYQTDAGTMLPLWDLLQAQKKISEPLQKYLNALDTKLTLVETEEAALLIFQAANKEIASNTYAFEKGEQTNLINYLTVQEAQFEYWVKQKTTGATGTTKRLSACQRCILRNRLLGIGGLIASPVLVTIDVFSNDATNLIMNAMIRSVFPWEYCRGVCNPPTPQNCQTCPSGYTFDGANCASGVYPPKNSTAFMWSGNFYYSPQGGTPCPIGGTFDSRNCYYSPIPGGYQGFIWNNSFYVKPKCN